MNIAIESTIVPAPADATFAYLAELANLPEWATEFVLDFRPDGERAVIRCPFADEATVWIESDPDSGVVDFHMHVVGQTMVTPARVTPLPGGSSLFAFTMVQSPEQSDEAFEGSRASLRREFENVRAALSGAAV